MIPIACISIKQIHIYLTLGIFSPKPWILFFLYSFQLSLRINTIFQVSRSRVCFSNTFIMSHKFFEVLSQTMILLLSLGLGSRRLSEGLIFTSPLVPAYLVQTGITCTWNESSNSVSGNGMLLPWLVEPCCLFPFTPGVLANFKVQYIVFVITQLKVPLQQKHTEKLQVETAARTAAPHPKEMML